MTTAQNDNQFYEEAAKDPGAAGRYRAAGAEKTAADTEAGI